MRLSSALFALGFAGAENVRTSPMQLVFDGLGITTFHRGGINGNGSVVGITDSGIYMAHEEFNQTNNVFNRFDFQASKVVHYETFADGKEQSARADGTCGHGTHVAGILAGRTIGAAPNAKISFLDIAVDCPTCGSKIALKTPQTPFDLFQNQTKAGAKVISFSWGTDSTGNEAVKLNQDDYNPLARQIDSYLYDHPDVLLVTAAGNGGEDGFKTLLSPAGAKNVLTIGATFTDAVTFNRVASEMAPQDCGQTINMDTVAYFSSRGPTQDGRLKPDIVVPGMYLVSARSMVNSTLTNDTCRSGGTSQATPLAASLALLVHEWLRKGSWFNGTANRAYELAYIPSSLVKALLIHSSRPVLRRVPYFDNTTACSQLQSEKYLLKSYPDTTQGYGRPNLTKLWQSAAFMLPNHTGLMPSISTGYVHEYALTLTKAQPRARITIVWTDPPAVGGAPRALTNDLDLRVQVAGDVRIYPMSNRSAPDTLNNVEMIELSYDGVEAIAPRSLSVDGKLSLTVQVVGSSVPKGPQMYSLVSDVPLRVLASQSSSRDNSDASDGKTTASSSLPTYVWIASASGLLLIVLGVLGLVHMRRKRHPDGTLQTFRESFRGLFRCQERCKSCDFCTTDTVLLSQHIEAVHQRPRRCPHCEFSSANAALFATHVETFH